MAEDGRAEGMGESSEEGRNKKMPQFDRTDPRGGGPRKGRGSGSGPGLHRGWGSVTTEGWVETPAGCDAATRAEREAGLLQALGHPVRLRILQLLSAGEMCACEIEPHFHVGQSIISLNLRILKQAGILVARNNGADVLYRLRNPKVLNLFRILGALTVEEDEEGLRQLKAQSTGASR